MSGVGSVVVVIASGAGVAVGAGVADPLTVIVYDGLMPFAPDVSCNSKTNVYVPAVDGVPLIVQFGPADPDEDGAMLSPGGSVPELIVHQYDPAPPVGVTVDENAVPTVAVLLLSVVGEESVHAPLGEAFTTYAVVAPTVTLAVGDAESVMVAVAVSLPLLAPHVRPEIEPSELSVMPVAFGNV